MIKSKDITVGLVVKIRNCKRKFPEHWTREHRRDKVVGKHVTIDKILRSLKDKFGPKQKELELKEFNVKESRLSWYSDDLIKANKIRK